MREICKSISKISIALILVSVSIGVALAGKSKYPHEVTIEKKLPETGGKNPINKRSDK